MVRCQVTFLHRVGNFRDLVVCDEFQVEHGRPTSIAPRASGSAWRRHAGLPAVLRSRVRRRPMSINIWDSVTRLSKIPIHLTLLVVAVLLRLAARNSWRTSTHFSLSTANAYCIRSTECLHIDAPKCFKPSITVTVILR